MNLASSEISGKSGSKVSYFIQSATRSAIIIVVALVLARMQSGNTDTSTTRRFSRPLTRQYWSTTAIESESGPILQVPEIC